MLTRALVIPTIVSRHLRRDFSFQNVGKILVVLNGMPQARNYAKGKDKKKEAKNKKIIIDETLLNEVVNVEKIKLEMDKNLEKMNEMFLKHLSLRSSAGSIEQLVVNFEGKKYPLIELGQIIRNNPKTIVINMTAFPQAIPDVLKALSDSGMNLNPQQDGTTLFVPVPKITKEHRESLAKNAKIHYTKCKDGIRDVQNNCIKTLKNKEKAGLSTDSSREIQEQLKAIADEYINKAEKMLAAKQTELVGS
ncbi:unnamed protein product [Nesidiocoris tenuis]|uniref:Ribosome-recycling factor, mitochondrial n=1 Tax=Nesidiocoris tenuis TaxID=355587 RepID=A0A6H5HTH0_9HEMI|nr:unnamed protein product [Nesidiocoris tenuis]